MLLLIGLNTKLSSIKIDSIIEAFYHSTSIGFLSDSLYHFASRIKDLYHAIFFTNACVLNPIYIYCSSLIKYRSIILNLTWYLLILYVFNCWLSLLYVLHNILLMFRWCLLLVIWLISKIIFIHPSNFISLLVSHNPIPFTILTIFHIILTIYIVYICHF